MQAWAEQDIWIELWGVHARGIAHDLTARDLNRFVGASRVAARKLRLVSTTAVTTRSLIFRDHNRPRRGYLLVALPGSVATAFNLSDLWALIAEHDP